jgi:dTDP-4-dehydrorhamnose reductase
MRNNSIWITGAGGKIGAELLKSLKADTSNKVVGTDTDVDVTNLDDVMHAIDVYRPSVIINCASLSDFEYCEKNQVEAFRVNALGARNLASASRKCNAKIIQLSTDDVFANENDLKLTEFDTPNPKTVYGKSKLAGENFVRELNPKHLIIRSSWVYGAGKGDYFSYVLDNAKQGKSFTAPDDAVSSPTSTAELSAFITAMLEKAEYGIYHVSCEGKCSRYEFAKAILEKTGNDTSLVSPIKLNIGGKPVSTLLENLMMKMTGLHDMPHWQDALDEHIKLINKGAEKNGK